MKILLTNDDGIYFEGMWALYRHLRERHRVEVVAPDRERSAVGHGITLNNPIRAYQVQVNGGYQGYAVTGTPADCVKLGILELMPQRPDMVISGINPGANVGININYSGTVAAAKEAALFGVPAIAVSINGRASVRYDDAARFTLKLTTIISERGLPPGTFLNVNIPDIPLDRTAGIRFSRQGIPLSSDYFEMRVDPRNQAYYWQGCDTQRFDNNPDVDGKALESNYISITPIKCDMTDYELIEKMREWEKDL
jgi:5'-nucleotidase